MILRDLLLNQCPRLLIQAASRRSLSKSSQRPRPPKRHNRLWAIPGDLVFIKDILAKQYAMKWHPGLNAGIDHDRNIYALCDGVMIITEEEFEPDWDNHLVNQIYKDNSAPPYKRYIHVLPKHRISEFKLIDLV